MIVTKTTVFKLNKNIKEEREFYNDLGRGWWKDEDPESDWLIATKKESYLADVRKESAKDV